LDELPPACLGGIDGLTKSINTSVNLANAVYYNANNLHVGISGWIKKVPIIFNRQLLYFTKLILQITMTKQDMV